MTRKQIIAEASKILRGNTKNTEILETFNYLHKQNQTQTHQTS
jgi:hypothetical protein